MNLFRLPALLVLLAAFGLAACGNKADLFMPPPPDDDDGLIDDRDREGAAGDEVIEDEAAAQEASGLPLPAGAPPDLPLPVPTGDE